MKRFILALFIIPLALGCATWVSLDVPRDSSRSPRDCPKIAVLVKDLTGGEANSFFIEYYTTGRLEEMGYDAFLSREIEVDEEDLSQALEEEGVNCLLTLYVLSYGQIEIDVLTPTAEPFGSSQYVGVPELSSGYESRVGVYEKTRTEYKKVAINGELKDLKTGVVAFRARVVNKPLVVGRFALYKLYNRKLKLKEMARDALDDLIGELPLKEPGKEGEK